jgi:hypothetical protein
MELDPHREVNPINIGNINNGAVIEAFDIELRKVLANIVDLNTPATNTRALILRIDFKPHSDRCTIVTDFHCSSKLAPIETHTSKMFLGRAEDGAVVAFDKDPRQMPLWSAPKLKEVPVIEFGKSS